MADRIQAQKGRRYVNAGEIAGFVLFDMARDYAPMSGEWTDRILNIDRGMQALLRMVISGWSFLNDLIAAPLADLTRPVFRRFRPYLMFYPIVALPAALLLYLLPYIFRDAGGAGLSKAAVWALASVCGELAETAGNIFRTGFLANIRQDPQERLSMLAWTSFFSGFVGDLPRQVFGILRDIISRSPEKSALEINEGLRTLYTVMGIGMALLAVGMALHIARKQRSAPSAETAREKPPGLVKYLRTLSGNRPLLMLTLSDILDSYRIRSEMFTYTNAILNFSSFGLISGIPGIPATYIGYYLIPKLRQRISTKSLWIASSVIGKPLLLLVYAFGMVKVRSPAKIAGGVTRYFLDLNPMLVAFGIQEAVSMTLYAGRRMLPDELRSECIDYGEWKNGLRTEGAAGMLRTLPKKLPHTFFHTLESAILAIMGFQTGENYNNQTEKTARGVFALATIVPMLSSLISIFPKLLYNISQKDRERMYVELAERRAAAAETHSALGEEAGA